MERGSNSNGGSVNVPDEEAAGGYKCKTCRKRFDTFQALGGHQGIHKKIDDDDANFLSLNILGPAVKSSSGSHKCKLCMKVFESGPALGGHMTRHRNGKVAVESTDDDDRVMGKVKRLKTEKDDVDDDEEQKKRRELILAAKEWRLWPVCD